jgi:hypothetical protein
MKFTSFLPGTAGSDVGVANDRSFWFLLVANVFTIVLAYVQDWNVLIPLVVYWCQSVVIGISHFFRILATNNLKVKNVTFSGTSFAQANNIVRLFSAGFFAFHYGFFHLGYLVFLFAFANMATVPSGTTWLLAFLGVLGFIGEHVYEHYYYKGEEEKEEGIGTLMTRPYLRIIPMHLTIIFGFMLFQAGFKGLTLLLFLVLKTGADVGMHMYQHKTRSQG